MDKVKPKVDFDAADTSLTIEEAVAVLVNDLGLDPITAKRQVVFARGLSRHGKKRIEGDMVVVTDV